MGVMHLMAQQPLVGRFLLNSWARVSAVRRYCPLMTFRRDLIDPTQSCKANPFHYQVAPDRACSSRWRTREIDQANRPAAAARSGAGEQGRRDGRDSRACRAGSLPHCGWGAQGLERPLGRVRCLDKLYPLENQRGWRCRPGNSSFVVDGLCPLRYRGDEFQRAPQSAAQCGLSGPQARARRRPAGEPGASGRAIRQRHVAMGRLPQDFESWGL